MASIVNPKDARLQNNSRDIRGDDDTGVGLARMGLAASQAVKTAMVKFDGPLLRKGFWPLSAS
jgi:hypothetical protein